MKNGIHKKFIYFLFFIFFSNSILAEPQIGKSVILQILDKVTARISTLEILIGDKIVFESLEINILHCKKRPPEEVPEDFVLLQIFDILKNNEKAAVFQGWMLSSSPTIAPFEHPTYDVWVKDCKIDIE